MSLVGPRPALPSEVEHYDAVALRRLSVPQGVTCLWQINGRSEVSFEHWMELDNRYVDEWTPLARSAHRREDDPSGFAEGRSALSPRRTCGSFRSDRQRRQRISIAGSTLFIMGATFASTLFGFLREVVSARYYGTRWEMDTFLAAATIPTILFGVFNGALVSALVPTFSEYLAHRKEDEAWRLANTVLNILAIVVDELRRRRLLYRALVRAAHRARFSGAADGRCHPYDALADAEHRRRQPERRALGDAQRLPPFPRRGAGRGRGKRRDDRMRRALEPTASGSTRSSWEPSLGLIAQMLVQLPSFLSDRKVPLRSSTCTIRV